MTSLPSDSLIDDVNNKKNKKSEAIIIIMIAEGDSTLSACACTARSLPILHAVFQFPRLSYKVGRRCEFQYSKTALRSTIINFRKLH
jgi:hypothetical protein